MIFSRIINIYSLLFLLLILGCKSKYELLLRSNDNEAKYEEAKKLYQNKKYEKAITLLENIRVFYTGNEKARDINYTIADSYFHQEDFMVASYYYEFYHKNFDDTLKTTAMYREAYCFYIMSLKYTLEQTSTIKAINKFQNFINRYPESDKAKQVNKFVKELRTKLENKAFAISKLYFKHNDFKASIVSFNSFLEDFPDSKRVEEALFYIVKSNYLYTKNSIEEKKKDRKEDFQKSINNLLQKYPETKYKKELTNYKISDL